MVEVGHLHDLGSHDPTADQICIPKFLKKINYICVLSVAGDLNVTHLVKVLYTCLYGCTYHAPKKHVPIFPVLPSSKWKNILKGFHLEFLREEG